MKRTEPEDAKSSILKDTPLPLDGPNRSFYRTMALERPDLLRAVIRFNAPLYSNALISQFHEAPLPSRKETQAPDHRENPEKLNPPMKENSTPVIHHLRTSSSTVQNAVYRAARQLNQNKNMPVSIEASGFWEFEDESRRLALLDPATLKRLLFTWGAAVCAPILNQYIRREDITVLRQDIGQTLMDFAWGRGRFFFGEGRALKSVFELPLHPVPPPESLQRLMVEYAMKAYSICMAAWPESLQRIEIEKFNRSLPELSSHITPRTVHPSQLRAVWFSIKKVLLKEVAPQWRPCFS